MVAEGSYSRSLGTAKSYRNGSFGPTARVPARKVPDVSKRIVLCFDGTANQIGAGNLTNVDQLFEMLEKNDPASQLAYYDPGVGTLAPAQSSLIGKLTLLFEQAFGAGLKENVAQAYRYVMQHWRPGDAIYALVHPSVLVRRRDNPGYLPNLTAEQQRLSADPTDWTTAAL